jgi:hypothetical protein
MQNIDVTIDHESPLLLNRFTEEDALKVEGGTSVVAVGSRGTPRERAEKRLYLGASGHPMMPGPNIYRAIVDAGRFHKAGKEKITTSRSSLVPAGIWLLETEVPITPGTWEVDSRAVVNPATGGRMMAHRPRFDVWCLGFTLQYDEKMFSEKIVRQLVDDAGQRIGLGDYRPARKGPFGRFKVVHWEQLKKAA